MIPKQIYIIIKSACFMHPVQVQCINQARNMNPGWTITVLDWADIAETLARLSPSLRFVLADLNPGLLTTMGALATLHTSGGIVMDSDLFLYRSFDHYIFNKILTVSGSTRQEFRPTIIGAPQGDGFVALLLSTLVKRLSGISVEMMDDKFVSTNFREGLFTTVFKDADIPIESILVLKRAGDLKLEVLSDSAGTFLGVHHGLNSWHAHGRPEG